MPGVPPPYREVALDGSTYFKILGVSQHLIGMYESLLRSVVLAEARPGGTGIATATKISVLIAETARRVDAAAIATARFADEAIRERIQATLARPPTFGVKDHPSHLAEGVLSRPVPSVLRGGGSVGIADISELDRATTRPSTNSNKDTYWEAVEFGSDHIVGKTLYGVFQPGDAKPVLGGSGHPVFEYRAKGTTPRFKMTPRNAIQPHEFLQQGAYDAYLYRRELHQATEAFVIGEIDNIIRGDLGTAGP